ncbi:MAG: hypothetical protein WCI17_03660 [bacterium]
MLGDLFGLVFDRGLDRIEPCVQDVAFAFELFLRQVQRRRMFALQPVGRILHSFAHGGVEFRGEPGGFGPEPCQFDFGFLEHPGSLRQILVNRRLLLGQGPFDLFLFVGELVADLLLLALERILELGLVPLPLLDIGGDCFLPCLFPVLLFLGPGDARVHNLRFQALPFLLAFGFELRLGSRLGFDQRGQGCGLLLNGKRIFGEGAPGEGNVVDGSAMRPPPVHYCSPNASLTNPQTHVILSSLLELKGCASQSRLMQMISLPCSAPPASASTRLRSAGQWSTT